MPYKVMYNNSVYARRKTKKEALERARILRKRTTAKVTIEYVRPKRKK